MTLDDYVEQAKRCARRYADGDSDGIELLARIVFEADQAKQKLREMGFGWSGLSLLHTVYEIRPNWLEPKICP